MSAPPERATVRWRALGTTAELVVTDGAALAAARAAVERQLAAYDLACSRFRDDSELAAVNAAGGRAIEVSRTFAHAVAVAHAATGVGVLVSLGGDVAVAGDPPDDGWIVRVGDDHAHAAPGEDQTIVVRAGGLATSGTTVRRWRAEGEQRHHLLDPRSGRCAASPWRTVSVAAGSCVDANTASTAALVRGDSAPAWLARLGLPARLVRADGEVVTVAGWPRAREALGC